MKLAVLAVLAAGLTSTARADVINPPGGPVTVDVDVDVGARPAPQQRQRPMRGNGQRDPRVAANRQRLRQTLLQQFDTNGDGRLEGRERIRAIRTLRRLEERLAASQVPASPGRAATRNGAEMRSMQPNGAMNRRQYRQFMKRYDVNGDGRVGPREVPRGAADKLRKFDRNGDGWVEPNELPRR